LLYGSGGDFNIDIFINILVYAYDNDDPEKQDKAQKLLTVGIEQENLVLSVQVLGEFFNAATRNIPQPLTADEVGEIINTLSVLPIQEVDLAMVNRAVDTHKKYQISYRDSLIVSAAERAGCTEIITEDLSDGQSYHDIRVRNPFKNDEI
jgi:predicted nucleic acid-binding protein